jgi:hypothetical protein
MFHLLVTVNAVSNSPILATLIMEAVHSCESLFLQEAHSVKSQEAAFFFGVCRAG